MKYVKITRFLLCAAILLIAGCGGAINATIGGTVTGLLGGTSVVLLDNGVDTLTVNANGSFTFPTEVQAGSSYDVTIATQPAGEICLVENPVGEVEQDSGNVASVVVDCQVIVSSSNIIVGTVLGLAPNNSVTLLNNGTDSITVTNSTNSATVATTGGFAFSNALAIGALYSVVVQTQPAGQTCTVANPTGTIPIPAPGLNVTCH